MTFEKKEPKDHKKQAVTDLRAHLEGVTTAVLSDYRGLTHSELTALRRQLRDADARFMVVKNNLFKLALEGAKMDEFLPLLVGPNAVALTGGDAAPTCKALVDFASEHKAPVVKGAYVEGRFFGPDDVAAIARLPAREVLLAQFVSAVEAPISGFVSTLNGVLGDFVRTISAIADQKQEAAA